MSDFSICAGYSSGFQNILHYVEVYVHILAISLSMWGEGYIAMVNKVTHMHLFISFCSFLSHALCQSFRCMTYLFLVSIYLYVSMIIFLNFFLDFFIYIETDHGDHRETDEGLIRDIWHHKKCHQNFFFKNKYTHIHIRNKEKCSNIKARYKFY